MKSRLARAAVYVAFLSLLVYVFAPYLWLIFASLSPKANLQLRLPDKVTLENFAEAFSGLTLRWIRNSFVLSLSVTLINVLVTTPGGYALSRGSFRGKSVLMYGIILTRIIPTTLIIVPLYGIMLGLRLLDTYTGLILVEAGVAVPFSLWIMKGAIDAVPLELEEAAEIDGASRLRILFSLILPLVAPGLGAVSVMSFVGAWGGFVMPLILLSTTSKYPISVGVFTAFGVQGEVDFANLATLCLSYMLPVIILYLTLGSYFQRGLGTLGSGDR